MPDGARAALLAALTLVGLACMLLLLSLLIRCAAGDEGPTLTPDVPALTPGLPVTTPKVPEGRSPYTGPMARSPRSDPAVGPLRPAPGAASEVPCSPRSL
ncbi:MAG: hypothetical protein JXA93_19450 [Anaerolineae bacterium]|nr:hypothetical protein [Anaerolineae bacterium]